MNSQATRRETRPLLKMRIAHVGEPIFRARTRVMALARRLGFRGETLDGIVLAFSEALSNALLHTETARARCVHVTAGLQSNRLVLEILDHGPGFQPSNLDLPSPTNMCESGRGLYLMNVFMDEVNWQGTPNGTTVRMCKVRQ